MPAARPRNSYRPFGPGSKIDDPFVSEDFRRTASPFFDSRLRSEIVSEDAAAISYLSRGHNIKPSTNKAIINWRGFSIAM
jgi:hypothetical protein